MLPRPLHLLAHSIPPLAVPRVCELPGVLGAVPSTLLLLGVPGKSILFLFLPP